MIMTMFLVVWCGSLMWPREGEVVVMTGAELYDNCYQNKNIHGKISITR